MDIEQLKHVAGNVRALLARSNHLIGHGAALDLVASMAGLRNWAEVRAFPDRLAMTALDLASVDQLALRLKQLFAVDVDAHQLLATISNRTCALCNTALTKANSSKEHLILNAIGGRRKISGFLCANCNSSTGEDWDAALAEQLNPFSVFLGIQRERGTPPPCRRNVMARSNSRITDLLSKPW